MDYKYLLALNHHPQIGSGTLRKILAVCPDPGAIWLHKKYDKQKLGEKILKIIDEVVAEIDPDEVVANLIQKDIGYVTIFDKEYPKLLKTTNDYPVILYIRGDISAINRKAIAVVGSRKYTNYGKSATLKIVKECASSGLCIVSGLALGIDTYAHQGALAVGGITVGVLGCGLDRIYPASNYQLGKDMLASKGAIISEYPPGTIPNKFNFPMRNRIVAGMTLGTLVVEAATESGALITAYQALDYNRDVFAVPGNIDSEVSAGTNKLIQAGAKLVTSGEDVLVELGIKSKMSEESAKVAEPENEEEKLIYEILRTGEKLVDQIIHESKMNIVEINSTITMMELKGLIVNSGGGKYKLK
jgi:DNA processing protein